MVAIVESFVNASLALFGLIWGSYLNVVVYRLPKGLSTAVPASHCPRCASRIQPVDNVPVLSWMVLGARCRACGGAISVRYPLVEMAVAALFVLGFHRFDRPLEIFVSWVLGCVLLAVALIDFDRRLVPVLLVAPVTMAGWAVQPVLGWIPPAEAVLTSLAGAALALASSALWQRFRGEAGLGAGDAHVLALIGAFFGAESTLRIALVAFAGAAGVALLQVLTRWSAHRLGLRADAPRAASLPLATFLGLAALWSLLR